MRENLFLFNFNKIYWSPLHCPTQIRTSAMNCSRTNTRVHLREHCCHLMNCGAKSSGQFKTNRSHCIAQFEFFSLLRYIAVSTSIHLNLASKTDWQTNYIAICLAYKFHFYLFRNSKFNLLRWSSSFFFVWLWFKNRIKFAFPVPSSGRDRFFGGWFSANPMSAFASRRP